MDNNQSKDRRRKRNPRAPRSGSLITRFWSQVDKRGPDECWPWIGSCWVGEPGTSYGLFVIGSRKELSHRFSLEVATGSIGHHMALHTCDNPPCVNPRHLYAGTPKDNARDRSDHGRIPKRYAVGHRYTNLPLAAYLERHGIGCSQLADQAGISPSLLSLWLRGKGMPKYSSANKLFAVIGTELSCEEVFGVSLGTLAAGVSRNSRLSSEQMTSLRRRRKEGATFAELAIEFGVSVMTAWMACNKKRAPRVALLYSEDGAA